MSDPARRLLDYADLLAATRPDERVPELIDGELAWKASPRAAHALAQSEVCVGLAPASRRRDGGGWWILVEPDVVFSEHRVLRPDLAGWRRERLPFLPEGAIRIRPDWVCEVLSPGHEAHDTVTKRAIYGEEGVPWLWLLSPEARQVEVFELRDGSWLLRGAWTEGAVDHLPPFDDIEIEVALLFPPRPPGEPPVVSEKRAAYRAG